MLTIIPTPIGNLGDITLRALEVLRAADLVACEDTRHSRKLLNHFDIHKPLAACHEHSRPGELARILDLLRDGKSVALISDSGTPLMSDPGYELVRDARREGIPVEVLPGPFAAVTALVASGLATDGFTFLGFPPVKGGQRKKFLEKRADAGETLVLYESPHRVLKTLEALLEVFGDREAAVCRELTKKFEEVIRGTVSEILAKLADRKILGEIVLVVAGAGRKKVFSSRPADVGKEK